METKTIIMTLLVLTILFSIATVAFDMLSGSGTVVHKIARGHGSASVGLFVEGGEPSLGNSNSNIGFFVEGS